MNVYIDSANFSTATTVYLDSLLLEVAPDGYYSNNSYYRQQIDGKLIDLLPCVGIDTVSITAVGETTATFNGNLINNGGDVNAVRGFVYGTSTNPTIANSVITDTVIGQGTYSLNVTGLTTGVTYYVRAYTIVFGETIYGDELNFINTCPNVTIGTQIWTGCNLNVDTYKDGTPIPEVTDPTAWAGLTTGAWCWYDNSYGNGPIYGKLYNWYAVNDPRGLAPIGYHMPSDAEWTTLTTFLGGESVAGGKMKETGLTHWFTPNTGATNSSGFTALPGGDRSFDGSGSGLGYYGFWWSSTEFDTISAVDRSMSYNNDNVNRNYVNKTKGASVRLIKD